MAPHPAPDPQDHLDTPITIQDVIMVGSILPGAPVPAAVPAGEFGMDVDENMQSSRLFAFLEYLFSKAKDTHDGKLKDPNHITRFISNEFFCYTKKPFTLKEFEQLQQKIADLAAKQPQNVHMVLSSFAVKTPDNKIMNVVAYVECGPEPKMHFIVKNHSSSVDPHYTEESNGKKRTLFYVNSDYDTLDNCAITIDGKIHPLSFDNIIECQAQGGARMHVCTEICSDHGKRVAEKRLQEKLQAHFANAEVGNGKILPSQCSHIVTSNWVPLEKDYALGVITHADIVMAPKAPKENVDFQCGDIMQKPQFGTPFQFITTAPARCSMLPDVQQAWVAKNNKEVRIYQVLQSKVATVIAKVSANLRSKKIKIDQDKNFLRKVIKQHLSTIAISESNSDMLFEIMKLQADLGFSKAEQKENSAVLMKVFLTAAAQGNKAFLAKWGVLQEEDDEVKLPDIKQGVDDTPRLNKRVLQQRYGIKSENIENFILQELLVGSPHADDFTRLAAVNALNPYRKARQKKINTLLLAIMKKDIPAVLKEMHKKTFVLKMQAANILGDNALKVAMITKNDNMLKMLINEMDDRRGFSELLLNLDINNNTVLDYAIRTKNIAAVKLLLSSKTLTTENFIRLVNAKNNMGDTVLMAALSSGQDEMVKLILAIAKRKHCEVPVLMEKNIYGDTLLFRAAVQRQHVALQHILSIIDTKEMLVDVIVEKNRTENPLLIDLIYTESTISLRMMLDKMCECGCPWSAMRAEGKDGVDALEYADATCNIDGIKDAHYNAVEMLSSTLLRGKTFLMHACMVDPTGEEAALALSLAVKAKKLFETILIEDNQGKTALTLSMERHHPMVARKILQATSNGDTLFMHAVDNNDLALLDTLLSAAISLNCLWDILQMQGSNGLTLLERIINQKRGDIFIQAILSAAKDSKCLLMLIKQTPVLEYASNHDLQARAYIDKYIRYTAQEKTTTLTALHKHKSASAENKEDDKPKIPPSRKQRPT